MKVLLKYLVVVVLAALSAGAVVYADQHCPQKKAQQQLQIDTAIEKYVENHSQKILENIAKNENFGSTVQNFSNLSDEELEAKIIAMLEKNPVWIENYIRDHADSVALMIANTDTFKNIQPATNTEETTEEAAPEEDTNQVFKDHWDEMLNNKVSPSVGPKDAKVTVVEFFDFACGHCKALAPVMSQLIKQNPDVRFIFNPLFFISEHSPYAAKVSLAAAEKGKFAEVFDGIMTLPDMNEETINQILTDEGLNVDEVKKMIDEKAIRRGVQDIDALSQVLGINGVPMLLINGEAFYGRSVTDIQNKINSYK